MECPQCKTPVEPEDLFCGANGHPPPRQAPPPPDNPVNPADAQAPAEIPFMLTLLSVPFLIAGLCLLLFLSFGIAALPFFLLFPETLRGPRDSWGYVVISLCAMGLTLPIMGVLSTIAHALVNRALKALGYKTIE